MVTGSSYFIIYSDCSSGSYGFNCSQRCSENCQQETCDHVSGGCNGGLCKAGFDGDKCDMGMLVVSIW